MKNEKKNHKTWDNFLMDSSNKEAYKACQKFASGENSPQILWLHGPSGCGKTHLAKATGGHVIGSDEAVEATLMKMKGLLLDLAGFFGSDMLIIDNMEDMVNMSGLQENIAELIIEKCKKGHRVMLISTCQPDKLETLNKYLYACPFRVKRMRMKSPTEDLRLRYAQFRGEKLNVTFEPDALDYLVKNTEMLTTIEGAVQTASLFQISKRCDTFDVAWVSNHLKKFKGCEILWE